VGHSQRAGADPVAMIHLCQPRLYDLHLKDVVLTALTPSSSEVEVGRGVLDIQAILQALISIKYEGHVGIEHERDAQNPLPGIAESMGYAKGIIHQRDA
jgi:sugar phosphate isomerase/epimerase